MRIKPASFFQPWQEDRFNACVFVRCMTPLQRWMYRTLLQSSFSHSTRPYLPNDDNMLWVLAGCESIEQWKQNRDAVMERFNVHPTAELVGNSRVIEDFDLATRSRMERSEKGRRGGVATAIKHGTSKAQVQPECSAGAAQVHNSNSYIYSNSYSNRDSNKQSYACACDGSGSSTPDGEEVDKKVDPKQLDTKAVQWLFDYFRKKLGKGERYIFTDARKRMVRARLKETILMKGSREAAVNFMRRCIDEMANSPWHQGENPDGKRFNDFENVFWPKKYPQWVARVEEHEESVDD